MNKMLKNGGKLNNCSKRTVKKIQDGDDVRIKVLHVFWKLQCPLLAVWRHMRAGGIEGSQQSLLSHVHVLHLFNM